MHTDQFSAGARRVLGPLNVSLTGTYVPGRTASASTQPTARTPAPATSFPVPGFGNVLVSDNNRESWYQSVQVLVEKPYSATSPAAACSGGATISYTLGSATEKARSST